MDTENLSYFAQLRTKEYLLRNIANACKNYNVTWMTKLQLLESVSLSFGIPFIKVATLYRDSMLMDEYLTWYKFFSDILGLYCEVSHEHWINVIEEIKNNTGLDLRKYFQGDNFHHLIL